MNTMAIEVRDVSKAYKIKSDIFWALKDVSFSVKKGGAVGIIGANGAGKTTILRLLAGVTSQSKGKVEIKGAIAPLIQVGAGFHPELTGRENVYLSGIIMGLSKKMVDKKFDDIVQFAELERFIDTPVKNYSSGMYVRLGFAVAININAEILLIDEILSVGDLAFQRKCLDFIQKMRRNSNPTIVYISHDMSAVAGLCDKVIWLDKGEIKKEGNASETISTYTEYMTSKSISYGDMNYISDKTRWGTGEIRFEEIELLNSGGEASNVIIVGEPVKIVLRYIVHKETSSPLFWMSLINSDEIKIAGLFFNKLVNEKKTLNGKGMVECIIDSRSLQPGQYHIVVGVYDEYMSIAYDRIGKAASFKIINSPSGPAYMGYDLNGIISLPAQWTHSFL